MQREQKLLLALDIITVIVIFLVSVAVLYPIKSVTNFYPFYGVNILFIGTMLMGLRYIFGLDYSFLARKQEWKIGVMLVMVPVIFLLIGELRTFMAYIEDESFDTITGHLPDLERLSMNSYIRREMLLFGIGAILACGLLPLRLMLSIWRQRNDRKVKRKSVFEDTDEY